MTDVGRAPRTETEADAWALEALASFSGTALCWHYNPEHDAFVSPGWAARRHVDAARVEALRATTDPPPAAAPSSRTEAP